MKSEEFESLHEDCVEIECRACFIKNCIYCFNSRLINGDWFHKKCINKKTKGSDK